MSILLVQKTSGIVTNPVIGGTVAFPVPTTAGNKLVLSIAYLNHAGAEDYSGIVDDGGNSYISRFNSTHSTEVALVLGSQCATFEVANSVSMQTLTVAGFTAFSGPISVWIYEVSHSVYPFFTYTDQITDDGPGSTEPTSQNDLMPTTSMEVPYPPAGQQTENFGTGGVTGFLNFYNAVVAPVAGIITSVSAPWVLDTVLNGLASAYIDGMDGLIPATFVCNTPTYYCGVYSDFHSDIVPGTFCGGLPAQAVGNPLIKSSGKPVY